jgi:hypothetical protein
VSKWWYIQSGETEECRQTSQASRVGEHDSLVLVKNSLVKMKCEIVHCHDTTASSFVAKVWDEVFADFYTVTIKHHSSWQN